MSRVTPQSNGITGLIGLGMLLIGVELVGGWEWVILASGLSMWLLSLIRAIISNMHGEWR